MAFLPRDTLRHWKKKIGELRERGRGARQEIERLRRENERLQQERERLERERDRLRQENEKLKKQLEEAQRAAKRQAAPFPAARVTPIPSPQDANPALPMASTGASPFLRKWMKSSLSPRPHTANVAAKWKWRGSNRSFSKKLCVRPFGAVSIFPSAVAANATNGCKGAIPARPPML